MNNDNTEEKNQKVGDNIYTAMGFWLPTGRANFYRSTNREIKSKISKNNGIITNEISNENHLHHSVYRRLIAVLGRRGFVNLINRYPSYRENYKEEEKDPSAVLMFPDPADLSMLRADWPDSDTFPQNIISIVCEHGFYLFITEHKNNSDKDKIEKDLKKYIIKITGDSYFSHFSGRAGDPNKDFLNPEDSEGSLREYRDNRDGILSFFQLNILFEGLYNYNFVPSVFFNDSSSPSEIEAEKRKHSVGNFMDKIVTIIRCKDNEFENTINSITNICKNINNVNRREKLEEIFSNFISKNFIINIYRDIIRDFLISTSFHSLMKLKWNIESCRRVLLTEMMSITHRTQPLIQVENPDEEYEHISGANEAQLRGYIMMIAAKFPLILNATRYLNDCIEHYGFKNQELKYEGNIHNNRRVSSLDFKEIAKIDVINGGIKSLCSSWINLVEGIQYNIDSLERAIEQAQTDRLLHEEEQIRAEQETMAEIERIKERTSKLASESSATTIGIIANVLTVIFIGITLVATQKTDYDLKSWLSEPFKLGTILAIYLVSYFIFHQILDKSIKFGKYFTSRVLKWGHKYYVEMDIGIDVSIKKDKAEKLFAANFTDQNGHEIKSYGKIGKINRSLPVYTKPERNSYRLERISEDEALHKIHIETEIIIPKTWRGWHRLGLNRKMQCFLTYEVLFHRPSEIHNYILRELRFISTFDRILTIEQVNLLKHLVRERFINVWLDDKSKMKSDEREPMMTLTYIKI